MLWKTREYKNGPRGPRVLRCYYSERRNNLQEPIPLGLRRWDRFQHVEAIFIGDAGVTLGAIKMQAPLSLVQVRTEHKAHVSTFTLTNGAKRAIVCVVRADPPTLRNGGEHAIGISLFHRGGTGCPVEVPVLAVVRRLIFPGGSQPRN